MHAAMTRILPAALLALGTVAPSAAWAQEEAPPAPGQRPHFEGAIGLQLFDSPQYTGSDLRKLSLTPGIYLRWGRLSVSTSGNFVTRYDDEVVRGIGAELVQRDDLRVQLGLRYDPGRKASTSPELAQLDDVRDTVRLRLSAVWQPSSDWRIGTGWSSDLLGRKTGALADLGVAREFRLSGRSTLSVGAGVSWGDEDYMRTHFGISPDAAARSGKPAYAPGAGLRDVALNAQVRTDLNRRWSVWVGGNLGRLVGPALDSPLTLQPTQASVGVGFAWRF
jgi:outer membrane scaffolding protein for murein synthesis (MipA/OmpV family)